MTAVYIYKILHLMGMALLLTSLAGVASHAAAGGDKASNPAGRSLAIAHGLGLLLVRVGGFGMLARLGLSIGAGWVWVKILIWLFFCAATVLPYRSQAVARSLPVVLPLIIGLAALVALFKPF